MSVVAFYIKWKNIIYALLCLVSFLITSVRCVRLAVSSGGSLLSLFYAAI